MGRSGFLVFVLAFFFSSFGQISSPVFRLVRDKKTDSVKNDNLLELYYSTDTTSSTRKISGIFRSINADSITLEMIVIRDDKQITKDMTKPGELFRFPVKDIQSVVTVRRKLENAMKAVFFASLAGALIVSPLAAIENGKLNWTKAGRISGICAIPAALSITISLSCWPKRHQIKPDGRAKQLWTIER